MQFALAAPVASPISSPTHKPPAQTPPPTPAPAPPAGPPIAEPKGWSPGKVDPSRSTRGGGLVRAAFDAWRGVPEASLGVALTKVQVDTLAPFLAAQTRLAADVVRADLEQVRVHVGGPAHGNVAVTIGHDLYVSDAGYATHILSWKGRTWLAHELAHTMQWRAIGADRPSDAARDRAFLNRYLGGFIHEDGNLGGGALIRAAREAIDRWRSTPHGPGVADHIHDAHPMERAAATVAAAFKAATK